MSLKQAFVLTAFAGALAFGGSALAQTDGAPTEQAAPGYRVSQDLKALPEAVRKTRRQLLKAARSGDMTQLKAVFDAQPVPPNVSFGQPDDPMAYLQGQSADGEGVEILAILAELLEAPYAVLETGEGEPPIYVWPYLAAVDDLERLDPAQRVDVYKLVDHEQFEEMKDFGGWIYWRVLIADDGALTAFVAGD